MIPHIIHLAVVLVATAKTTESSSDCYNSANRCFYAKGNCAAYSGELSFTLNGFICQKWNSQSPQAHNKPAYDHNYCRVMTSKSSPWCYTSTSCKRWDTCFKSCPIVVAWLFAHGKQTVTEFHPATKSLSPIQQPNIDSDYIIGASAQNDDIGVYIYSTPAPGVSLFNKAGKHVVVISNETDYDHANIGVSGEDVILLSSPAKDQCQSVTVLSSRSKEVIASNITMKECRVQAYCMGSLKTGDVYIFGGKTTNDQDIQASEKYSAVTKSMEVIADLPGYMRSNFSACLTSEYNGNIMVCGNFRYEKQGCYLYHPEENNWDTVGSFVNDRAMYKLVVIENDLFAIGGIGVNSIEKYNKETKAWEVFMTDLENEDVANHFYAFSI